MKKYIIPETMVIVTNEQLMEGMDLYSTLAGGGQLSNGGFYDDLDDSMDTTFKRGKHLWDDDDKL